MVWNGPRKLKSTKRVDRCPLRAEAQTVVLEENETTWRAIFKPLSVSIEAAVIAARD